MAYVEQAYPTASVWGGGSYTTYYGTTTYSTTTPTTTTAPVVFGTPPTVVTPDAISSVTGIDPAEVAAATYGKIIPIFVGGMPRLGCHIIFGPTFTTSGGQFFSSFGVSFGMPALNFNIREIFELRLDGYKVWSLTEGYLMDNLTFRFYPGSETQAADPLVIAAYPSAPVAHRGHACVFIENLPLAQFANKVPFVSAVIADTFSVEMSTSTTNFTAVDPADGVNLGYALDVLSYSPYVGLGSDFIVGNVAYGWTTEDEFETEGISERIDALIVAEKVSFLELLNRFARLHLWDVVQPDKLKIIERGTVAPDIALDFTTLMGSDAPPILIERIPPSDRPRTLDYSYIDINRDYEINTITAGRMSVPSDTTRSEGTDTIALPVVHTAQEAKTWATLRNFKDEVTRETISFTTTIAGYEIEPGDIVSVDAGFKTYVVRVLETLKGANWTNRIKAEPILRCAPPIFDDVDLQNVVLLLGPVGTSGTTFTDESPAEHGNGTVTGNTHISTAVKKFTSSMCFDGTGDYIQFADSEDWDLSNANSDTFTIEAWVYFTSLAASPQVIVGQYAAPGTWAWTLQTVSGDPTDFAFAFSIAGASFEPGIGSTGNVLVAATWYHIAVDKDAGGKIRAYLNGAMVGSSTPASSAIFNSSTSLTVGSTSGGAGNFNGYIEDLRITKGIARYASDAGYTIPDARVPREE